jgi:putative flippase GtrA
MAPDRSGCVRLTIAQQGAPEGGAAAAPHWASLIRHALGLSLPRFLAVGCVGLTLDAAVFSVFSAAGSPDALARTVSLAAATLLTWRLNRRFTFGSSGRAAHAEATRYVCVALGAQGFNLALFLALRSLAPALPPLLALLTSAVFAAGASFAGQSLLTFRSRLAGAAPATSGITS